MVRTFLIFLSVFFTCSIYGQQLQGTVIDKATKKPIDQCHVVNKRSLKGTLTDANGAFKLSLELGDTVVFSNIAYKYFYFIYNDTATALKNVVVKMEEQNYLLSEVSIFSYELTTNDPKEMEIGEPLDPKPETLDDGRIVNASVGNPAEYLYNLFGSKPRQLRELARLKAEDEYRKKLEENNNRDNVVALTHLTKEDLEAFMFYCKFSRVQMATLNDYEFLISVQRCYRAYVKEKELEGFLNQFD